MPVKDDDYYKKFEHPSEVSPSRRPAVAVPVNVPVAPPRAPARNPSDPVHPGNPVKTGGTYTVFPDKAAEAAFQATVVRKNDPPKEDAAVRTFQQLAQDIADLTAGGPGKVTQVQLDALHARAQSLLGRL